MVLKEQNGALVYSDGQSAEENMLDIARQYPEQAAADFIATDSNYSVNNTFSPVRHNLLNWYPFKQNSEILEVGAGMGSMTGLLCDRAKAVTALEMSESRTEVIRARFPKRRNLTVLNADITTWNTTQRFDYVVVVGVLEYAGVFSKGTGNEPYTSFLKTIGRLLKPDGVLLLAIENRFGLKYWLGASEDHLQEPFVGIAGYQENGTPKTFSKAELQEIFGKAGYCAQRYYYVLPDYKFPTAIFTDESLPSMQEVLNIGYIYSRNSCLTANERDLYKPILENGLFDRFANSYLIEAGMERIPKEYVMRVSARGECKPQYRAVTAINSDGTIDKKPGDPRAEEHICRTYQNGLELQKRGVRHIEGKFSENVLTTQWYAAPMANGVFCEALAAGNWPDVLDMIDALRRALEKSSEQTECPTELLEKCPRPKDFKPEPFLQDGYMDMTLYNAFWEKNELVFFDQEWVFPGLPLRFILYYGLKITYSRNEQPSMFPFSAIMQYIGVDEEEAQCWDALESEVWKQTLNRWGDVYGADGYCNRFSEQLTLEWKKNRLIQEKEEQGRRLKQEIEEQEQRHRQQAHQIEKQAELLTNSQKAVLSYDFMNREDVTRLPSQIWMMRDWLQVLQHSHANTQRELENKDLYIDELRLELVQRQEAAYSQEIRCEDKQNQLDRVLQSKTWRLSQWAFGLARKVLGWPFRMRNARLLRLQQQAAAEAEQRDAPLPLSGAFDPSSPPLVVPEFSQPLVSIVIPVFNEFGYTYRCIRSIIKHCSSIAYEIILADDCSTDATAEVETWIKGLRIVRNQENLRFLLNCNHAAENARGNYIVFLNNDTEVRENWLDSLLDLMQEDESVGLAGSKLLYPDGTLQEAGGIIWKDASAWNYGHGEDPEAPEFNYLKEVDYISGASIMVRADLWRQLGGFDERFAPAYFEDSDLAFAVRKLGYRVVYQPLSQVVHYEGITNGTEVTEGQKQHQLINRSRFLEKWEQELCQGQYPNGTHVLRARDRSKGKKIMLLVDHYVPTFDQDAGGRTVYEYVKLFLKNGYHVILLPQNFNRSEFYTQHYQQLGVEVLYGVWYANHWEEWFSQNAPEIDVIFLNRPHISVEFIDYMREHSKAKILYYGHDLHFVREFREYELKGEAAKLLEVEYWRNLELSLMRKADTALYPSVLEEKCVKSIDPSIHVMTLPPYIYSQIIRNPYSVEGRRDLLFVGGFNHTPNLDAMVWFVNDILPLVAEKYPDIQLHILGSNPPDEVMALKGPNVTVHGYVSLEELQEFYAKCRLSIAPLRYGAGIKGKVVEAMGKGMPVITTSIGAEGLDNADEFLAIGDEPELFAKKLCELYDDARELKAMSEKAYDYLQAAFSEESALEVFQRAIQ